MADQQKRTSDFSAQGPSARRPVSDSTLMQVAGEKMMQGGLGTMFSAAQRGGQAAATRAAYQQIGEENAENIRNRFYQKEMAQVKKLRIDPILEKIKLAEREYQERTALKVRPVMSIKNGPEAIAENEQLQQATAQQRDPQAVTSGAGESAETQMMPTVPQRQPNQITTGDTIGAPSVEEEGLTVIDPETGNAVNATTAEGQAILDRHTGSFWQAYGDANMELMDIFSEYAGNPFMDNAMRGLAEETMNQAGFGVTGQKTSDEQIAFQQQREDDEASRTQARADLDLRRSQISKADREKRQSVGMTQAAGGRARKLGLGDPSKDTMEKSEAEYNLEMAEWARKRQIRDSDGLFRFPDAVIANPGGRTLASEIRNEKTYKAYVEEELTKPRNDLLAEHATDPVAFSEKYASLLGDAKATVGAEAAGSTTVQYFVDQIARNGPHGNAARGNAQVRRMEEIATWQPELKKKMDTELAAMVARRKAEDNWSENEEIQYATNPVAMYVSLNDPSADVTYWSPKAKQARRSLIGKKAADLADARADGRPIALQPTPERLAEFHKGQAAKGAKAKITGRARLDLPRSKRNAAIPTEPLKIAAEDTALSVDIYKMNLEQLKNLNDQLAKAINDPQVDAETRIEAQKRLKEVQGLYSGPMDVQISRVGRNIEAVGNYVTAGLEAVSNLMETNRAENTERTRKLLTVPEATGGDTIGSPKSTSGK